MAWVRSSLTFSYIGETREARRRADIGLRLSPLRQPRLLQLWRGGGSRATPPARDSTTPAA